jgi:hypothetical protein
MTPRRTAEELIAGDPQRRQPNDYGVGARAIWIGSCLDRFPLAGKMPAPRLAISRDLFVNDRQQTSERRGSGGFKIQMLRQRRDAPTKGHHFQLNSLKSQANQFRLTRRRNPLESLKTDSEIAPALG